ncbi:class I SAM-dependent methyltransferase [Hoeflea sp. WL0058]|uniref:Class I SAM-dependent methyltransferase n=1 Tax=Flavimaribacter sediminis TaxID=2865987 RepID=A0AAE3D2N7_9HYPH|nr:class I SAM-dependent methyltransferase [Flavimaribacter sediminis]MBW8638783.1 class I SAM-dependent methyltransferase [Flavimaribacter sediminis]
MTTPLGGKIARLIRLNGPIGVADYFSLCLADPDYGYYRTREPFGAEGDFITAPEISQLFGELIGVFLVNAWKAHGAPSPTRIVELGPGRGVLMADVLRVVRKLAPDLAATATVELVETSERLRKIQSDALSAYTAPVRWHDDIDTIEPGFTLLVANEFFDALPIRQFVSTDSGFRERMVALNDDDDKLVFSVGSASLDDSLLPAHAAISSGTVFEISPARNAVAAKIAERIERDGGAGLIIDYGHLRSGFGDTLQAVREHRYLSVLGTPGEADLTSHVDFEMLAQAMRGVHVMPVMTQGDFLLALGLLERAGRLGAGKDEDAQQQITAAVHRLAGDGSHDMGNLFKVMCVTGDKLDLAPFFTDN